VREYAATVGVVAEVKEDSTRLRAELQEHEAELSVLRGERDTQAAILAKYREVEAAADAKVEEAMTERRRVKELQDAAFGRMSDARRTQRAKNDLHYANRRLSRTVRDTVGAGKVDEARTMCAEQMDEAIARLSGDANARSQYFDQWGSLRALRAAEEEELEDEIRKAAAGKGASGKAAAPAVEPAVKAQAVIAAALEAAAAGNVPSEDDEPAAPVANGHAAAPEPAAPAVVAIKPKKPKAHRVVVEPVVEPDDKFELPQVVLQRETEGAVDKAAERERNRRAQADAEARKAKREVEKAAKAEKRKLAAQLAAEAEAKEAAAAAAAAEAAAAKAAAAAAKAELSDGEGAEGAANGVAKLSNTAAAKKLPMLKAAAPKPVAKRPAGARKAAKRSQLQIIAQELMARKDFPMIAGVAVVVLLLLVLLLR
jgi:hypothetical protein